MRPDHQHYVAPVLEREAQSPGQHHGTPSMNGPTRADELHEEFMAWLEAKRPHAHLWWRKGWRIPERQWQQLEAEWRTE